MADFPIEGIIGITVGCVVFVIIAAALIMWVKIKRDDTAKELPVEMIMRTKPSIKRDVLDISGRFDTSDSFDAERKPYETKAQDNFVFNADALVTRENTRYSYDRPYSSTNIVVAQVNSEAPKKHAISGFGEVAMISNGGSLNAELQNNNNNVSDLDIVGSQTMLLPQSTGYVPTFNRPIVTPPSNPRIVYARPPESSPTRGKLSVHTTGRSLDFQARPDSFQDGFDMGDFNQRGMHATPDRPPVPIPQGAPTFIKVPQPRPGSIFMRRDPPTLVRLNAASLHKESTDSFRSSVGVDLGGDHQKAWMLSSLERGKNRHHYQPQRHKR